jgi:hypothetical protein
LRSVFDGHGRRPDYQLASMEGSLEKLTDRRTSG